MATRSFFDAEGRRWTAWATLPTGNNALYGDYASGWLTFQCDAGERRRLVPIPPQWQLLPDASLCRACDCAIPVRLALSDDPPSGGDEPRSPLRG